LPYANVFYSNRFQLIDSDNSGTKRFGIGYSTMQIAEYWL
jgi:hypothetical protein